MVAPFTMSQTDLQAVIDNGAHGGIWDRMLTIPALAMLVIRNGLRTGSRSGNIRRIAVADSRINCCSLWRSHLLSGTALSGRPFRLRGHTVGHSAPLRPGIGKAPAPRAAVSTEPTI